MDTPKVEPHAFPATGYIPSHHIGSPVASVLVPGIPGLTIAKIDGLPVFMQGKRPTCVSHGVAWAKMQRDMANTGSFKILSRRFLHALSKEQGLVSGDGRNIDKVLQVLETVGVCEEEFFPEDDSLSDADYEDASRITPEAYTNAALHKSKHGFITDISPTGLYNAAAAYGIVIIGMDISKAWWTGADGAVTWDAVKILPLRPGYDGNRHCVDIYAANTGISLDAIMNWWSDAWGLAGTAFFYSNDLPFVYEAAVLVD